MIEVEGLSKKFGNVQAVDCVSLVVEDGIVFGLLGTNGAGKSTLLRMMAGILKQDSGSVTIGEVRIYDNREVKKEIFYLSDDQYFFPNATPATMSVFYKSVYPKFDQGRFYGLLEHFGLDVNQKIHTYSKGMKKQVGILSGICANTAYLLCDEVFDGLDPIIRHLIKNILQNEIKNRGLTTVIASHNLRELEDICSHIGILHKGGVLLSKDIGKMVTTLHKLQCVFDHEEEESLRRKLDIVEYRKSGFFVTMLIRGEEAAIMEELANWKPVCCESVPLTIEEIFTGEMERIGYDSKILIS